MINKLDKDIFKQVVVELGAPKEIDNDFLYDIYISTVEFLSQLEENALLNQIININQVELINYCIGEYIYSFLNISEEHRNELMEKEKQSHHLAGVVADKFITLSYFSHNELHLTNKYLPAISSLNLYLNFILNILNGYQKNDPVSTLITDLLNKSVSIAKCVLEQLVNGYETEAFALWRTLHECECTLVILEKYGEPVIHSYLKHMKYGLAFKGALQDENEVNKIFEQIKSEMKQHDLKSKDMKKYIEYGYLYDIPNINQEELKLNFRDGLQKEAGLSKYNKVYLNSSEIIHSTPLLIYSDKTYFYYITLINLYESFFRLEKVFTTLFISRVSKEQFESYQRMRQLYYAQLIVIHQREMRSFLALSKQNNN